MVDREVFFFPPFFLGLWSCPYLLLTNAEKLWSKFWLFCLKHDTVATAVPRTYCGGYAGYNVLFLDVIKSAGF